MPNVKKSTENAYVCKRTRGEFTELLCNRYGNGSAAEKAYGYVCENMNAKKGFYRLFSGEDYYVHTQAVAEILIDMVDADCTTVTVALLHDCIEDMAVGTEDELLGLFGEETVRKVKLLTKENGVDYHKEENMNKYLSAILTDTDAILVKIADRMNNNSTYNGASEEKKKRKTAETLKYFVPLAEKAIELDPKNAEFYREAKGFFELEIK